MKQIKHVCVPLEVNTIAKLKDICNTTETKEAVTRAVEFRIKAGKTQKEVTPA